MNFWKAHGLGNDYLVSESELELDSELVIALCDRYRGVGADGVLEPFAALEHADYGVRIWNPDGSLAEKSGNGLRIFARWLYAERSAPAEFSVWTGACKVACRVMGWSVLVEMGAATFEPAAVPVTSEGELVEGELALAADVLTVTAVGMGNPHCVVFRREALDGLPWRRWGAEIERHVRFPQRTNVQFARILDESSVDIRIWERGAGETQASGSSSCAVAAAAVRTGRLKPGRIRVCMPGGTLFVTVSRSGTLLEGPVEAVGRFTLDSDWLAARKR